MAIEKITNELESLNILSNSGDTITRLSRADIKYIVEDGEADAVTTILEKIITKLDELTDKANE
jgi:hypothetical protein